MLLSCKTFLSYTILCKDNKVTHPKQHKSFYWDKLIEQMDCPCIKYFYQNYLHCSNDCARKIL